MTKYFDPFVGCKQYFYYFYFGVLAFNFLDKNFFIIIMDCLVLILLAINILI